MFKKTLAVVLATATMAGAAEARDTIRMVGSSTVYPFATAVAEQFGKTSTFKTPVVESTGTGGGIKLFCAGADENSPDIVNASRKIEPSEVAACAANGVKDITEVTIGYDGIVFANVKNGPTFTITRVQFYKAAAKVVPVDGKLVPNPYKNWNEIDPSLPKEEIILYVPAPNHGTRDAFNELVMTPACKTFPEINALEKAAQKAACETAREDGAFIDVTENYTVTLQKMVSQPHAVGVTTFSYLDQNGDKIKAATVDGVVPTYDNIASGKYPVSRPLFFYVKKDHVGKIPGIKEYIAEFTSEKAWSKNGYLAEKGLIALPDAERKAQAANAKALGALKM
jgi:phosphate transport system substrate-binding protein